MKAAKYLSLKAKVKREGFENEIVWSNNIQPPKNQGEFFWEYVYVVLNSGMKQQVARKIFDKVRSEVDFNLIGHPKKRECVCKVAGNLTKIWEEYKKSKDKFEYISKMPYMGPIIRYHLAKNFGLDVIKPDRHLVRIAKIYKTTPQQLCEDISKATGDKIVVVDTVIWRAANLGLI